MPRTQSTCRRIKGLYFYYTLVFFCYPVRIPPRTLHKSHPKLKVEWNNDDMVLSVWFPPETAEIDLNIKDEDGILSVKADPWDIKTWYKTWTPMRRPFAELGYKIRRLQRWRQHLRSGRVQWPVKRPHTDVPAPVTKTAIPHTSVRDHSPDNVPDQSALQADFVQHPQVNFPAVSQWQTREGLKPKRKPVRPPTPANLPLTISIPSHDSDDTFDEEWTTPRPSPSPPAKKSRTMACPCGPNDPWCECTPDISIPGTSPTFATTPAATVDDDEGVDCDDPVDLTTHARPTAVPRMGTRALPEGDTTGGLLMVKPMSSDLNTVAPSLDAHTVEDTVASPHPSDDTDSDTLVPESDHVDSDDHISEPAGATSPPPLQSDPTCTYDQCPNFHGLLEYCSPRTCKAYQEAHGAPTPLPSPPPAPPSRKLPRIHLPRALKDRALKALHALTRRPRSIRLEDLWIELPEEPWKYQNPLLTPDEASHVWTKENAEYKRKCNELLEDAKAAQRIVHDDTLTFVDRFMEHIKNLPSSPEDPVPT